MFFYDPDGKTITIDRQGVSHSFSFDDIELVERFKSYPLAEDRMQWLPWDSYNFSIINLKSGERFLITSLLVLNMDLPIPSNKIRLKKSIYPLASLSAPNNPAAKKQDKTPDTFKRTLSKKSDEELQNIISSDQGAYDKLFIEAARQELKNRS